MAEAREAAVLLFMSVESQDVGLAEALLDLSPEVLDVRCWPDGPSALGLAALRGALPLARLLLDRGADVNFVWGRSTPLLAACDRGHEEMAKLLIERGADTTYRSIQGATVLMHAATSNNVQLTRSILSLQAVGIDERSTSRGQSAFFSACFYGAADTARVLLLEAGADPTLLNFKGQSALEVARERGHTACVELIEWFESEQERVFQLVKARRLGDDREVIRQAPSTSEARTRSALQRAREQAAPVYVRSRVRDGESLPFVEVLSSPQACGGPRRKRARSSSRDGVEREVRKAVLDFVFVSLSDDLFVELVDMVKPR